MSKFQFPVIIEASPHLIATSETGPISPAATSETPDVLAMLLADKRSENTRRAYRHDVRAFFAGCYAGEPTPERLHQFLALPTPQMTALILRYKAALIVEGRAEATVNRRLAAILSLVRFARRVGATEADPARSVDSEKTTPYRDTRGISPEQARQLLRTPDRATHKGRRDYALLLLLLENALRRSEVVGMSRSDFEAENRRVAIYGKGRGAQKEFVTLSPATVNAIKDYLRGRDANSSGDSDTAPLFASASPGRGHLPLTADGLYKIVGEIAARAGLALKLSPHRLRHTAITLALDAAGGDIRRVQRLSRHARLETLQIYDDNRSDLQGEVTNLLSRLLAE